MRKSEVRIGMKCLAHGHAMGPATIVTPPEPDPYRQRRYRVHVDYRNAPATYDEVRTRNVQVQLDDIAREWTAKDQERFERIQQRIEDQRGWKEELQLAGFDGDVYIDENDKIRLTFIGRAAELVIEKLTGHTIPDEKRGEYIGRKNK